MTKENHLRVMCTEKKLAYHLGSPQSPLLLFIEGYHCESGLGQALYTT
jgi:hypothetical protein